MQLKLTQLIEWLKKHGFRYLVLPILVYLVVVAFITWPMVTQISTRAIGTDFTDSFEFVRLGWWGGYALRTGQNPFYQGLFAYPNGFFNAIQWAQPLTYWPIALLGLVTGSLAAFNIGLLLTVVFSGVTAYWLCLAILEESPRFAQTTAALLGGLVFITFPVVQGHLSAGHINILSNYGFPLLVLSLYRIFQGYSKGQEQERGKWRIGLFGAFSLALLMLSNYTAIVYEVMPLILFGTLYLLIHLYNRCQRENLPFFRQLKIEILRYYRPVALVFIGGLLLVLPFYIPVIAEALSPVHSAEFDTFGWVSWSTDLLSFVSPSLFTSWLQPIVPVYSADILKANAVEGAAYFGLIAFLLVIVAFVRQRQKVMLWLVVLLGAMIFSLGPILKVREKPVVYKLGDNQSTIVLPYAALQSLPVINITRTPGRFNFTTALCLGILAAIGLNSLLTATRYLIRYPVLQVGIGVIVALIMIGEYQLYFPFPSISAAIPDYFHQMAQDETRHGAVFDVPWDYDIVQKEALYQQTAHHQPLLAGYVVRRTPVSNVKLNLLNDVVLNQAYQQGVSTMPLDKNQVREILHENGVSTVIYHWKGIDKGAVWSWAVAMFNQPAYQDQDIAIFEISKPDTPTNTASFTYANRGWWQDFSRKPDSEVRWITDNSTLYLYAPPQQGQMKQDQQWTFSITPLLGSRQTKIYVDDVYIRTYQVNDAAQQVSVWATLAPGFHTLRFVPIDGCIPIAVTPLCMTASTDRPDCAPITDKNICVSAGVKSVSVQDSGELAYREKVVALGSGLSMRGFRMPATAKAGDTITIETSWLASQKLSVDYHQFVTVLDQQGKPYAQVDTVPDNGLSPTTTWQVGIQRYELGNITLPANLPTGTYQVYTGWYSYPDIVRLPVEGTAPGAQNGMVYLGDVVVK